MSLVPDRRTCWISFHDRVVVSYELTFDVIDSTDVADDTAPESSADVALEEFSCGSNACPPSRSVVDLAGRLSEAVINNTIEPEITIDVDGALAFDLRLRSGLLMFAELQTDGSLCVTILDDRGEETSVVDHLPSATEPQFMDRL